MLKLFKKSIWIPYEDSTVYPTVAKAQQAIIKYCEDNGYDSGSRGNYGIKCREK